MRLIYNVFIIFFGAILASCATSGKVPLKIHAINSLSSPTPNSADFQGLEFLADPLPGELKSRVNVIYLHGIGWTENPDAEQLADDFLSGIARAYGRDVEGQIIKSSCGKNKGPSANHIYIKNPKPRILKTAISGSTLTLDRLLCVDKQTLVVDDALEFAIYRVFWDDIFWNALQYPHVGQDDSQGTSQDIAMLRRKYNRRLKDELINYGISDAVMYLGAAGGDIRAAIEGALCAASLDAAGYPFAKQADDDGAVSYIRSCATATNTSVVSNQFAFVTESLGSKIMFDVLQGALTDGRDSAIDDMVRGSETFMLANQIPLLSLSDFDRRGTDAPLNFGAEERPKIIAMSELNDFLTYELVPFYTHLWNNSVRSDGQQIDANTPEARTAMVEGLGFDVIDMRLEFADKVVRVLKGFVDPLEAHGGHVTQPELMQYILCGTRQGKLNDDGCLATELLREAQIKKDKEAWVETPDFKTVGRR